MSIPRPVSPSTSLTINQATSPGQIEQVRELFLEYANSLGFSLCFQGFDQELAALPGDYAPPEGRLLLAEEILRQAREIGYQRLRLDTVEPAMKDAVGMYRRLGFREIAAYRDNPMAGTLYLELDLTADAAGNVT